MIHLQDIYERFAQMMVRGKAREIFSVYKNMDSVMKNYKKINAEIYLTVNEIVEKSGAPFDVIDVQISNVKQDPSVVRSKNELSSANNKAAAIEIIGKAIRQNPEYLEQKKYEVMETIGTKTSSNLIVMDTNNPGSFVLQAPSK